MKNRKGSFTVFVLMIFSSLMVLVWAVITASAREAVSASADHFGRLWGTSILAEYDVNLKDRYGLYAYFGEVLPNMDTERVYPSDVKKALSWYNLLLSKELIDGEKDKAGREEADTEAEESNTAE